MLLRILLHSSNLFFSGSEITAYLINSRKYDHDKTRKSILSVETLHVRNIRILMFEGFILFFFY